MFEEEKIYKVSLPEEVKDYNDIKYKTMMKVAKRYSDYSKWKDKYEIVYEVKKDDED